jgi:hypothetical protein
MKKIISLILLVVVGQLFQSCDLINNSKPENISLGTDFNPVVINNEYEIRIPDYMKSTTELNDEASLQYQNMFKEAYIVILDELKADVISTFQSTGQYSDSLSPVQNYSKVQSGFLDQTMTILKKTEAQSIMINGLNAEVLEIDGEVEGIPEPITYFLTFVEGKEKIYMIMEWTLQSRKEKYRSTFNKSIKSFREI